MQEIHGKADAAATRIYGEVFGRDPEFYAFSRTLEMYGEKANKNAMLILTTDSDFYRHLKQARPEGAPPMLAPPCNHAVEGLSRRACGEDTVERVNVEAARDRGAGLTQRPNAQECANGRT